MSGAASGGHLSYGGLCGALQTPRPLAEPLSLAMFHSWTGGEQGGGSLPVGRLHVQPSH